MVPGGTLIYGDVHIFDLVARRVSIGRRPLGHRMPPGHQIPRLQAIVVKEKAEKADIFAEEIGREKTRVNTEAQSVLGLLIHVALFSSVVGCFACNQSLYYLSVSFFGIPSREPNNFEGSVQETTINSHEQP